MITIHFFGEVAAIMLGKMRVSSRELDQIRLTATRWKVFISHGCWSRLSNVLRQ